MRHTQFFRSLWLAAVFVCTGLTAQGQEPYAVLSEDKTTLTFYYDDQMEAREGMSVGPFEEARKRDWHYSASYIETVVFDASFAAYNGLTSTAYWFASCSELDSIAGLENLHTDGVTEMHRMFYRCSSLRKLDVSSLNTANVENTNGMFYGCSALDTLDLSALNLSNVENMAYMFRECSSLKSLILGKQDTHKLTDITQMFYNIGADSLDVSGLRTDSVENMEGLFWESHNLKTIRFGGAFSTARATTLHRFFSGCDKLEEVDLSTFQTDSVKDMGFMFYGCITMPRLDVSLLNMANVENMEYIFGQMFALESINLKGLNTARVKNMKHLFYGDRSLKTIDLSSFDTHNVEDMTSMFLECSGLEHVNLSSFNTANVWGMDFMFQECSSLKELDLSNFNTENVEYTRSMFQNCTSLKELDLTSFELPNAKWIEFMFNGCTGLTSLKLPNLHPKRATWFGSLFRDCSSLTELDLSGLDTDNATQMEHMFEGCTGLKKLDLRSFKTENVNDMNYMFAGCTNLETIDLTSFNAKRCENFASMFADCKNLRELDPSGLYSERESADLEYMFMNCTSLTEVDLSCWDYEERTWWDWSETTDMFTGCSALKTIYASVDWWEEGERDSDKAMFEGCEALVGGAGTAYDKDHIAVAYSRIDRGTDDPGYLTYKEKVLKVKESSEGSANYADDIDADTDLNGNVINNICYCIRPENGSYDASEGCITLTATTADADIDGTEPLSADFLASFTGIVFELEAGSGTITVTAETAGTLTLKVKIGSAAPMERTLSSGKTEETFTYNVAEPTYVFIYAGEAAAAVRPIAQEETAESALKLYAVGWEAYPTAIDAARTTQTARPATYYDLRGLKHNGTPKQKGIYILRGEKVIVK